MEGESEYGFWHALVRDVAYAQIPRTARSQKHRKAGSWIETAARDRLEDVAEVIAHHYVQAVDLARAAGQEQEATEIEPLALRFLVLAGDRALPLDVGRAETHYAKALEMAPSEHPQWPDILARWADAIRQIGRQRDAARALEEAAASFRDRGDVPGAARTMVKLTTVLWNMGDPRCWQIGPEAVAMLEAAGPSADLVAAYANLGSGRFLGGEAREAIEFADKAISLAAELGLPEPGRALGYRGSARCDLGDAEGLGDMRRALALMVAQGQSREAAVLYNNLALYLWFIEGPAAYLANLREGIDFSERRGIAELVMMMTVGSMEPLFDLGSWTELLEVAGRFEDRLESMGETLKLVELRGMQAKTLAAMGRAAEALSLAEWAVQAARDSQSVDFISGTFSGGAPVLLAAGEPERALELLSELEETPYAKGSVAYAPFLPGMVRTAIDAGDAALAERLTIGIPSVYPYHQHVVCAVGAALAEARGEIEKAAEAYAEAGGRWDRFGVVPEKAFALLGQGRCLVALGKMTEAAVRLRDAREIFVWLG